MNKQQLSQYIGLCLRERRCEMGLSQVKLAKRSGVNRSAINQIEQGKKNITVGTLNKIMEVLSLTLRMDD